MNASLHVARNCRSFLFTAALVALVGSLAPTCPGQTFPTDTQPLVRVVDLRVGETSTVELCDGSRATVKLVGVKEHRDRACFAVRRAEVQVEVNGEAATLVSATYHLPQRVGGVQIDCSITGGYNTNGSPAFWGLDRDARLRLWPADSPWIAPHTFRYPVKQRWFATETQMANTPVFVDGGDQLGERTIYYHSGLDIGGSEGLVDVVAATDALVVSVGETVLDGHREDTPVSPRYDVVYLLDHRGWYYRYSHLKSIDEAIKVGRVVAMGDPIGVLGKEGGSGGWSHLHFEIKSRQPSGRWGTQEGYAFLWQAYQEEYRPPLLAVARPHQTVLPGETVTLDGSKSFSRHGAIASYHWEFEDGSVATGPRVTRRYQQPGRHSEILKVVDDRGNVAYDFQVVLVVDPQHPERKIPSIHANYAPTFGLAPGTPITFKVRTFNTTSGKEVWDFGDGSPRVTVQSDGNAVKLAPDGYAAVQHRYHKPGDYLVRVERTNAFGVTAAAHLHVAIPEETKGGELGLSREEAEKLIAPYFAPPATWQDKFGDYRSPLLTADGKQIQRRDQWFAQRQQLKAEWIKKLGNWPPLLTEPQVEVLAEEDREGIRQLKLRFRWTPDEHTTGYLLLPADTSRPRPAVLTVYYDPETAIGRTDRPYRDFAIQLARRGFVTLSVGTTEATAAKTYALYYPSLDAAEVQPLSMLACAAANCWYVLAARPEVDPDRIGIVGHSFGGKWAMFASCLFDKFACGAWSDPGIVFDNQRPSINYWEPWYLGYHPQPWRKRGLITADNPARGLYPQLMAEGRDLHELHALMAPRPFLVSGGSEDPPKRWEALNHTVAVNQLLGCRQRVGMSNRPDHAPNADSNALIYAFFSHFLGR